LNSKGNPLEKEFPVAAREGGLWGGALPEIYKGNKENIFF
jgi:hypothetical protein